MELDTEQISKTIMEYVQTNYSVDSIQTMLLRLAQSGLEFLFNWAGGDFDPNYFILFLLDWKRMLQSFDST